MLGQWLFFQPKTLDREIEAALFRNHIEEQNFKFETYETLQYDYHSKFTDHNHYNDDKKYTLMQHAKSMRLMIKKLSTKITKLESYDVYNDDVEMYSLHLTTKRVHIYNDE